MHRLRVDRDAARLRVLIAAVRAGGGGGGACASASGAAALFATPRTSASTRGGGLSWGSLAASAIAINGATPSGLATATKTPRFGVVVIA